MTRIEHGDWVVVCDGRKALILTNMGDHMAPNLRTPEVRREHARGANKVSFHFLSKRFPNGSGIGLAQHADRTGRRRAN
jgi:protein required for attachment to host cells